MDTNQGTPDIPDEGGVYRPDQMAIDLADDLIRAATAVREHFSEGRIQEAHDSLSDVLWGAGELIKGCDKRIDEFQFVAKERFVESPGGANFYALMDYHRAGDAEKAHEELHTMIQTCAELMRGFRITRSS
jgi:hypothetical protein